MASDRDTRIEELKARVTAFACEREWDQFHSPKNLRMALAVEAAELLEFFQWMTEQQSSDVTQSPAQLAQVRDEVADVAVFLLNLCNRLEIDLAAAVVEKLEKNAGKYPTGRARGRAAKCTEYQP
jgi:dCTP diphosphatase